MITNDSISMEKWKYIKWEGKVTSVPFGFNKYMNLDTNKPKNETEDWLHSKTKNWETKSEVFGFCFLGLFSFGVFLPMISNLMEKT